MKERERERRGRGKKERLHTKHVTRARMTSFV